MTIRELPNDGGRQRTSRTEQSEEARDVAAPVVGRAGEKEGQRRPEDAERAEAGGAEERRLAQVAVSAGEGEKRGEQRRVSQGRRRRVRGLF